MNLVNLSNVLAGQPEYRLKQAKEAVFKSLVSDWNEAGFLPAELREKLIKECPLEIKAEIFSSFVPSSTELRKDKGDATKATITLSDDLKAETVLMRHADGRNTVCVSSMIGCPLACSFCATGKMGFKRNLTAMEIVEQVLFWARKIPLNPPLSREKSFNIVFMGMGEPFLNYENVIEAIKILNDKDGLNIGARHISISTSGIVEGILRFANEKLQACPVGKFSNGVNLAISLHATNDELRAKLMPVDKKYPLEKVFQAVDAYILKTNRQVMFEYLLIDKVNDSDVHAQELAKLMKKPLYFVNLILYNPIRNLTKHSSASTATSKEFLTGQGTTGINEFKPSPAGRVAMFKEILEQNGVKFSQRHRFGGQIKAACGQLANS